LLPSSVDRLTDLGAGNADTMPTMSASAADWITAWTSVAAAVGTVGTLVIGGAVLLRERRHERELVEREQAVRVAAWHQVINGDDRRLPKIYPSPRIVALLYRNDSDLPVYDACLWWQLRSGEHDRKEVGVLAPHSERATGLSAERRAGDWITGAGLTFRDAAGALWTRTPTGELQVGQHEPAGTTRRDR
jgi:hypothetical protein